jgi:biopolymer transport protein ExbD
MSDMTPMIDMTFQLIAFFMVLLNFSDAEQDQRINLPLSELAKPPDEAYVEPLTVQMTKNDTVLFAGDEIAIEALEPALKREAQILRAYETKKLSDVTVIIRADREVPMGRVQEVMKMCQQVEFNTFALRGRQTDTPAVLD